MLKTETAIPISYQNTFWKLRYHVLKIDTRTIRREQDKKSK